MNKVKPKIQTLPPDVSSLLAAGQVIDSLAAVVRELVENSLDAGANRITLALEPDFWRLQLVDNGQGMSLADLGFCLQPSTTSKIYSREDLNNIQTLGFRGEALYALSQLADLEICSRTQQKNSQGWRLVSKQGKIQPIEAIAMAPGTIVTVSNLFGNWQTRRENLPQVKQQLKAIQQLIEKIALCQPQVTWLLQLKQKLWFQISPSNSAKETIPQILKSVKINDLQQLKLSVTTKETQEKAEVEIILGLPDRCHRRRADWIFLGVNGRMVKVTEIEATIINAFSKTLPSDRYPLCFVHLHLPPSQIDWNRHPAKTEIYLHPLSFWQEQITQAITQTLALNRGNSSLTSSNQRLKQLLKASEAKGVYQLNQAKKTESSSLSLINLTAKAQLNKTYIVAEHSTGIWLIEQHIAHERVLYEKLEDNWLLVPLSTPIILNQLTLNQVEQLQRLGIEIEEFGEQVWAIRNIPELLASRNDCGEALRELSWGSDLQTAQAATACRSAIKNGTPLNLTQMQNLLDQWKNTRKPHTCPHGRPIYLSLEESSLARFFRRHWVIGKSHGI